MNSSVTLFQAAIVAIMVVYYQSKFEVNAGDASSKIGSWFRNLDKKIGDEENQISRTATSEQETPVRKLKYKRHRKSKLMKAQRRSNEDISDIENTFKRPSKKKHGKNGRRFVKSAFEQLNNSDSFESVEGGKSKPVDIIVHIKMNE